MYVIIIVNCLGYWQPRNLCSSAMFSDCLHSVHQYWQPGNLYCSTFRLSPQSSPLLAAQKPLALLFNIQTVSTETPVLATQKKPLLFNIQIVSTETPVLVTQKSLLFNSVFRPSKRSTSRWWTGEECWAEPRARTRLSLGAECTPTLKWSCWGSLKTTYCLRHTVKKCIYLNWTSSTTTKSACQ